MGILKSAIEVLPGGHRLNSWFSFHRRSRKLQKIGDAEARFTHIIRANKWQDAESRSGAGSLLSATVKVRQGLTQLFDDLDVTTVLDAPCGDFDWMQHLISDAHVNYIGSDIVKPLIDSNQSCHGGTNTQFIHADVTTDMFPHADLWLCRDCLIHLSFDDDAENTGKCLALSSLTQIREMRESAD